MEEDKRSLAAVKQSVYYRNWCRARDRALVRLARIHKDEFQMLMEEEKERDEKDGKTWSSDGFTIIPPLNTRTRESQLSQAQSQQANRESAGNL